VEALIALCGKMELKFLKNAKEKRKKEVKILVLIMCFNSCSFEILEAKKNQIHIKLFKSSSFGT
jgi:hypothetical protein